MNAALYWKVFINVRENWKHCFFADYTWTSVQTRFNAALLYFWVIVSVKWNSVPVKWQCYSSEVTVQWTVKVKWKWVQKFSEVSVQWCVIAVKYYALNTDAFTQIISQTVSDCLKLKFKLPVYTFLISELCRIWINFESLVNIC